jgi:hypothetical protein
MKMTLAFTLKLIAGASLLWAAPPPHVFAGSGVVGTGTPASCTEAALDAALAAFASLTFNCGPASHTLVISDQKTITEDRTIDGGGLITLSTNGADRLFYVSPGTTLGLANITLANGYAGFDNGGCIYNYQGTLTIVNSILEYCRLDGSEGGAIYSYNGILSVADSQLQFNQAATGAAVSAAGAASVTDISGSSIYSNTAEITGENCGGGISNAGTLTLTGVSLMLNLAGRGGGICNQAGTVTLLSSSLERNGSFYGGGLYATAGTINIAQTAFIHNVGYYKGGGIYYHSGFSNLHAVTFTDNASVGHGGAIFNLASLTLTQAALTSNQAVVGGGIYNGNNLTLVDSTLNGNRACVQGVCDPSTSGLASNSAGGGVYNANSLYAWNSTFSGNGADGFGAAVANTGTANLYNVTVAHNVPDMNNDGDGHGAVYNAPGGTFNTRNTLLAANYRGVFPLLDDCWGTIWSDHSRFSAVPGGCSIVGPSSFTTDPYSIASLADNGGPTLTVALVPGSDAIDAADPVQGCVNFNSLLATDQRGAPRIAGASCDVGAYEFEPLMPRVFIPGILR